MRRFARYILGFAIVGVLACSDGPEMTGPCVGPVCNSPQLDAAALFAETCSGCHSLEGPIFASISHVDEAWALVREMNNNGLTLPAVQQAAIVEYLCTLKGCVDS